MSAALKISGKEMFIDLKAFNTFVEIKAELYKELCALDSFLLGSELRIDVGNRPISRKEKREIEEIVLDHGLYLTEIMSKGPPDIIKPGDSDSKQSFAQLSPYEETTLICRNLRSGQKFFTEGNVVILGDINPGAEVIAGGNILVMGALRGMVHAGAFGDESVVIAAYRLNPTQLRIARHITRPPEGELVLVDNPELARIKAGRVIIEKLKI